MNFKRTLSVLLAVLLAAALIAFAACAKDKNNEAQNTEPAETEAAPTEAAAPEPTAVPTPEPGPDYSQFDEAFARYSAFITDPSVDNIRSVFPEDFFTGMKALMDASLEEAGISYSDMSYEDFDAMLAQLVSPEVFAAALVREDVGGKITDCVFTVKNAKQVDVSDVIAAMGDTVRYLNAEKFNAAYKLTADVTVTGSEGSAVEENRTVFVYEYDGVYYIGMFTDDAE